MLTPSPAVVDTLWLSLNAYEADPPRPCGDHPLLTREQTAARMRKMIAVHWRRRNPMPASKDELIADLAPETAWHEPLERMQRCIAALDEMSDDDFTWTTLEQARPMMDQEVLYYFDIVGTHPGFYEGSDPGAAQDVFAGLFGGFLGDDVTHWMPMPGEKL